MRDGALLVFLRDTHYRGRATRMSVPQEKSWPEPDEKRQPSPDTASKSPQTPKSGTPPILITSQGKIVMISGRKQGGFIKQGLDGAGYHLMETTGGLRALQQFSRMGQLTPLYVNQHFFDALICQDVNGESA